MIRVKSTLLAATIAATALTLGGCVETDPLLREGQYWPLHANRANLALMAANPSDLVRGSGETGLDGPLAAAAVDRLYTNKLKKLAVTQTSGAAAGGGGGE